MGWFSRTRSSEATRGTDAAWAGVVESVLTTALMDWQKPAPVDRRLLRDVAGYVLHGEAGGLGRLQQALQNQHRGFYGAGYLDEPGRQHLVQLCAALSGEELDRWERYVHFLTAVDQSPAAGTVGVDGWLPGLVGQLGAGRAHPGPQGMTVGFLMALAERLGSRPSEVVERAVAPPKQRWDLSHIGTKLATMPDWGQVLVAHTHLVAARLTTGSVDERERTLGLLAGLDDGQITHFVHALAAASTTTSSKVREAALPLLSRADLDAVLPCLDAIARDGKPDTRVQALSLMWQLAEDRPAVREAAREIAAADRAASVQALLGQWDASDAAVPADDWALPHPSPVDWRVPESAARRIAQRLFDGITAAVDQANRDAEQLAKRYAQQPGQSAPSYVKRDRPHPREVENFVAAFTSGSAPALTRHPYSDLPHLPVFMAGVVADEACSAAVVLKCAGELDRLRARDGGLSATDVFESLHARTGRPTLLELQLLLDDVGLPGADILWKHYSSSWRSIARTWPDEDVWPFVATNLDLVLDEPRRDTWDTDSGAMYRAIGTLPSTPARVVERLYDAALGTAKTDRARAQEALAKRTDRTARAAAALSSGKAETRLTAAQWLTELADPVAVPPLEKAYAKERQDTVRGALLDALEACGRDPEDYLTRERLIADAERSIAKGLPKDLAWLAWDSMPEVRWTDGAMVPRPLLQGLAVQAVKARSPEPNAIIRRACAMFDRADAERFAERLLAAWLAEDLKPAPGGPPDQPGGSATATKGLLAIVGACGGQRVVGPTERYLREWYGMRSSQGKSLLAMLSWVDHPTATQLVLSVGSRFRTKAFQEEAVRLAAALAERKGWTLDELADRTIPTAGFAGDGVLELPYGDRVFTARLLPDLTVHLSDPDGKVVKSLPQPRQSDDAELAKESKKTLAAARKELKDIARLQHDRLYEALCTGRTWLAGDWQEHLAAHPVIRHQIQRLVWVARPPEGEELVTFRLLEDGTLTDVDDEPVELDPTWRVSLAHQTTLPAHDTEGWSAHLADYEVSPLFQQFGKEVYELPAELRHESQVAEFTGHVLEAFQLRGRALKLGWSRGPVEDAGWFHRYEKRFATLGLVAHLGFSGNGVPEENRTVALTQLAFVQTHGESREGSSMMLRDVPPVLLSECRHDLAAIASLGPGYDENWEKTVQW
jgi:hypothetical protein